MKGPVIDIGLEKNKFSKRGWTDTIVSVYNNCNSFNESLDLN